MQGSPPPMRGKDACLVFMRKNRGITPAHAGKRDGKTCYPVACEDHPRPCGEKLKNSGCTDTPMGSPPPMRGKESALAASAVTTRITPAHAGKRGWVPGISRGGRDHPRPCGEKRRGRASEAQHGGSPPPMRGKGKAQAQIEQEGRITPAHAGKSRGHLHRRHTHEDHPRPCGEKPSTPLLPQTV